MLFTAISIPTAISLWTSGATAGVTSYVLMKEMKRKPKSSRTKK